MEWECKRVKGVCAKSCLACGKVKQKCVGAVWEGEAGLNGVLMGTNLSELTGLVWELVGEVKELKETMDRGFKNVVQATHSWHWTHVGCA